MRRREYPDAPTLSNVNQWGDNVAGITVECWPCKRGTSFPLVSLVDQFGPDQVVYSKRRGWNSVDRGRDDPVENALLPISACGLIFGLRLGRLSALTRQPILIDMSRKLRPSHSGRGLRA